MGVLPDRDNVGEVFGVMPESEENAELEWEVDEELERDIFGRSGVRGGNGGSDACDDEGMGKA